MTAPVNHLDKLAIFQVDFDLWSGQVKLESPDLKIKDDDKPDVEVVDLGRKYIINRKHLRPFNSLKTQARRLCLRYGMAFFEGAFAVPIDKIDLVSAELDGIAEKMKDITSDFLSNYDKWVDEWIIAKPEYSEAIRIGRLPKAVVEKRFGFDYQIYQMNPVNEVQTNKLNGMAAGLADELMDEIVEEANRFFHSCLKGKESCQANTQKTLKRLCDKVDGLSFLDSRFLSVVELLNKTISGYAGVGKTVIGEQFYRVLSATLILSSRDKIKEYASGDIDVCDMANSFMLGSSDDTQSQAESNVVTIEQVDSDLPDETLPDEDDIDQFFRKHVANGEGMFF